MRIALASRLASGVELSVVVRYGGSPKPLRSLWGDVGFEELTDGVLVVGQPNGAASWFPCNDHPSAKASFHIRISTESRSRVVANGTLVSRRVRASQTVWTYEQPEPTSSYLVTITAKVLLTAHDGTVLYRNDSFLYREQYQSTQDLNGFIQEDGYAVQRIARAFAQAVVSDMLESF